MPILTKDQVIEAALELNEVERNEVIERLVENERPLVLTEEQKIEIRRRVEVHRVDPSKAISRVQLMATLDAHQ